MEQLFAGIGYFIYKAIPAIVVSHYIMEVVIYLCMEQKWPVPMGERKLWLPLTLPIHTVSATLSMDTREYNKPHLKLGQTCLEKVNSLEGDKFEQASQRVRRRSRSVGACRDRVRTDLEKLMVFWGLHLHLWSSAVHKLFKH